MHNPRNERWVAGVLIASALLCPTAATAAEGEWHCTYTDDPEVYECRADEPLRSQAELEATIAQLHAGCPNASCYTHLR